MARQSFYFLTDGPVRIEFHVRSDLAGMVLDTLFHPAREPDSATFESADQMADAMAERVKHHMEETGARLSRIRYRYDADPITYGHLGRYAVPLLPEDDGSRV